MSSFLMKIMSKLFLWKNEPGEDDLEIDENKIFSEINGEENETYGLQGNLESKHDTLNEGQVKQFNFKALEFVHKTGVITHTSAYYGAIDGLIYFEPSQVSLGLRLKENDVVCYTAYKARDNETERVHKIYALKNESWEHDFKSESAGAVAGEIPELPRMISGKVFERKERKFFIVPLNIWLDLDKVEALYVPVKGDWVSMEATVTANKKTVDLDGDIQVKSIRPTLVKNSIGVITLWSSEKEEGSIEDVIYVSKSFCEEGYIPNSGDEVTYDAIKSDQESYRWRALKVQPYKIAQRKDNSFSCFQNDIIYDENKISIIPSHCNIVIELDQTKTITFEVTNNGDHEEILTKTHFSSRQDASQLTLTSPKLDDRFMIKPQESVEYVFECRGKFLGLSRETFVFCFNNFMIGRRIEINVTGSTEMNELLECKIDTVVKVVHNRKYVKQNIKADMVLFGPKPWKTPKFVAGEKRRIYKIPKQLWSAVVGDSDFPKSKSDSIRALEEYAPYLKEDLNIFQYGDRFHTLLYLEEIEIKQRFRRYDMNGVFLFRNGEYLVLKVPGLVKERPSLIPGGKIILTQSWSEANNVQQIGYIHEIHHNNVFVKFHEIFQENYDESQCDIIFEPNLTPLATCHDAVRRSIKKLGAKWLFPSSVDQKPPQIDVKVDEDFLLKKPAEKKTSPSKTLDSGQKKSELPKNISTVEPLEKNENCNSVKKKLTWYNKNLNGRQKLAVVKILRGEGRPLPYIIFGPPGTGKTITLVEVIMQIYRMMPDSRLLVATPSNSSADLICERLIKFGKFKPENLIRLVALCRSSGNKIPAELIPYSTTVNIRNDNNKRTEPPSQKGNFRSSTLKQLKGTHRITVGTCVCVSSLHYLGFQPGHFTHILVDEAGQTTEPELLICATFQNPQSGQVVLTGDPKQLGPVCLSTIADQYGLGVSLLQRLVSTFPYVRDLEGFPETSGYDPRFVTKLNVNYRSVPEILTLPNRLFYHLELIPTVSQTEGVEADIIKRFNFPTETGKAAIIFHGILGMNYQETENPSWYNPHEVWQTVSYLKKCYKIGLTCDDIGIITPYAKQVQKLHQLLTALKLSVPKIGTVEDFQGQERYVIIVSTVRSSFNSLETDIRNSLGFVASPRRLNVALTRARALLIILGNPVLLSKDPFWKSVVEYCVKNGNCTGCGLDDFYKNDEES